MIERNQIMKMEQAGLFDKVGEDALLSLLKDCSYRKDINKGVKLHASLLKRGLVGKNIHLGNALASIYVKCGKLDKSVKVFDEQGEHDVISWNTLIGGHAQQGHGEEALTLFEQMQCEGLSPNAVTYVCVLKACASIGTTYKGKETHARVMREGVLVDNNVVGNALVDMYAKCGRISKAQEVFQYVQVRNVVSWNVLITGYIHNKFARDALYAFFQMQQEGFIPDAVTFVCIFKACASLKATNKAKEMHAKVTGDDFLENNIIVSNTVLDMYVKCDEMRKAEEIFDDLKMRDVISWNVLFTGYSQQGCGEEALKCFERMQCESFSPTAVSFTCVLKACGSIVTVYKGKMIHAQTIMDRSVDSNILIGNALVDMYAKCGALEKAQEAFDKLKVRDTISWNSLIAGYAQHGHDEAAIENLDRMQHAGLNPDAVTFVCVLKACGSMGSDEKGKEIHAEMLRQELLEKNVLAGNALIDMYARCGTLSIAQEVFRELRVRDIVSWNALMTGYAQHGYNEEALQCFKQMQREGPSPNAVTLVCILKACGNMGALDRGEKIHDQLISEKLLVENNNIGNALVSMYAKCGALVKAQDVFDKLQVHDVVSWNALISGYVDHGRPEKALSCFERMCRDGFPPNAVTLICVLKACGSIGSADKGEEIYSQIKRDGILQSDSKIITALVDMYCKCGKLEKAEELLKELHIQNVSSWNALLCGYSQHEYHDEVLTLYQRMQSQGVSLDAITYVCALKACGSVGTIDNGAEIHGELLRKGFQDTEDLIGNALVDLYAKCGDLKKAQAIFDKLQVHSIVSWTTLIAAYTKHGYAEEALNFYDRMVHIGVSPDMVTYLCVLQACGNTGAVEKGKEIHDEIARGEMLEKEIAIGAALVDMYCKCGALEKAQQVFDAVKVQNVVSWTALITGFAQQAKYDCVIDLFNKMIEEDIQPDDITFTVVLNACCHSGNVDKGEMYFEMMSERYGIVPTMEQYTCMVDILSRAGHFDKAIAVIKKMPTSECLMTWITLLGACRKWGNVNLGRLAFEHAIQLDANRASSYVCMSNIYAAAGMQEEADEIDALKIKNKAE